MIVSVDDKVIQCIGGAITKTFTVLFIVVLE